MILVRKFGTAAFRNNYYFKDPCAYERDVSFTVTRLFYVSANSKKFRVRVNFTDRENRK